MRPLVGKPFVVGELVVSFWEYLPEVEATDLVTVAGFLRQLHIIPVLQDPELGPVRPFARIAERIESAATLAEADRRFSRARHGDLCDQWERVRLEMASAVVCGDAHNENLVRCGEGRIVCMDLERSASGSRSGA